jgi:hypothetical protein
LYLTIALGLALLPVLAAGDVAGKKRLQIVATKILDAS